MYNKIMLRRGDNLKNQFDDFYSLMDQFYNDAFGYSAKESMFKMNVENLDDSYLVEAELPGFSKDEIHIHLENGNLTISAKKDEEIDKSDKEKNYICKEIKKSSMSRTVYFENIDENNLKANLDNGVLKISIPKDNNLNKSKKIEIE